MTFGRRMLALWSLDPGVTYLNHPTVGATPRRVLARQQVLRDDMERQPSRFMLREVVNGLAVNAPAPARLRQAASAVARFVGVPGDELVFVDNATAGMNAVLRSLRFAPGDEIVLTDHSYGAIANLASFVAEATGASVRIARLPYPACDPDAALAAVAGALTPATRLLVVDHITAASALVLPIERIVARSHQLGIPVIVDGAHAPGMQPLDLRALGADWYVGNLHKWAFAPRSCAFLWAPAHRQAGLRPPVIGWGYGKGFVMEFDCMGTRDPTPFLAAPEGIAFLEELGFAALRDYTRNLALAASRTLTARWGTRFEASEEMVGSMVTLPLPASFGGTVADAVALRDALLSEDHIEVQLHAWQQRLWVRVAAQAYNDMDDVERLAAAVARRL